MIIQIQIDDVYSSNIKDIMFQSETANDPKKNCGLQYILGDLSVLFRSGSWYNYKDVRLSDVMKCLNDESFGSSFSTYIAKRYKATAMEKG